MRPLDAINAGYDEITHIYSDTMQAMPDSVARFEQHGALQGRAATSRTSISTPSR